MTGKVPGVCLKLIREPRQEAAVGANKAAVQVAAGKVERAQARRLQILHEEVVDEGHVVAVQVHGIRMRYLLARPARPINTGVTWGGKHPVSAAAHDSAASASASGSALPGSRRCKCTEECFDGATRPA